MLQTQPPPSPEEQDLLHRSTKKNKRDPSGNVIPREKGNGLSGTSQWGNKSFLDAAASCQQKGPVYTGIEEEEEDWEVELLHKLHAPNRFK